MAVKLNSLHTVNKAFSLTHRYLPVGFSLIVGVGLSLAAAAMVWQSEQVKTRVTLEQRADNLAVTLQSSIDEYVQITRSLGAFFDAADEVTTTDFQEFATPFVERYPGIHGMAWLEPVKRNERGTYERTIRVAGRPDFRITERNAEGEFITALQRDEYFPVTYGEPTETYREVLGFDFGSEPSYRTAVEKARDTGEIAATERVILANRSGGLALYRPVYRSGTVNDTVEARRQNFLGMVYTIYKLPVMVRKSLEGVNLETLDFYLIDKSAAADRQVSIFYNSIAGELVDTLEVEQPVEIKMSSLCQQLGNCTRDILVADREWTLLILPNARFAGTGGATLTTLAIGFLLTVMLTIYLAMSIRRTSDLEAAMKQLQQTQAQLVQAEKMSSIGQLVAGVAHEINNPVSFIYGNITHADEYVRDLLDLLNLYEQHYPNPVPEIQAEIEAIELDFILEDLPKTLYSMKVGADRIREIVLSLRNFSRMDEAQMKEVDIHEGIDSTLMILRNRLKETAGHPKIKLIKEYGNLPKIECYPGQLNQVFMNLIANAIDALEEAIATQENFDWVPTIAIRTEVGDGDRGEASNTSKFNSLNPESALPNSQFVGIRIQDNGIGISQEAIDQIFNPFFTTKPIGKGTGLGLSISYQIIIEKHKGMLKCFSGSGKGTEFYIQLPIHPP